MESKGHRGKRWGKIEKGLETMVKNLTLILKVSETMKCCREGN
jgi:hypothetical protein